VASLWPDVFFPEAKALLSPDWKRVRMSLVLGLWPPLPNVLFWALVFVSGKKATNKQNTEYFTRFGKLDSVLEILNFMQI